MSSGMFAESEEGRNARLLRRFVQEVWNEGRLETILELRHANSVAHGMLDVPVNREGFIDAWSGLLGTLSDLEITLTNVIAQRDLTAAHMRLTGRHTGSGLGVQATGKPVTCYAQVFTRWRDGLVVECWNTLDTAAIYRQIGAVVAFPEKSDL